MLAASLPCGLLLLNLLLHEVDNVFSVLSLFYFRPAVKNMLTLGFKYMNIGYVALNTGHK